MAGQRLESHSVLEEITELLQCHVGADSWMMLTCYSITSDHWPSLLHTAVHIGSCDCAIGLWGYLPFTFFAVPPICGGILRIQILLLFLIYAGIIWFCEFQGNIFSFMPVFTHENVSLIVITFLLLPTWYTNFLFIHINYIKLNSSACFEWNPLVIRRSTMSIIV